MKTIGIKKKMEKLGRVVIPIEYRKEFGINEGDYFEIQAYENGILITPWKHEDTKKDTK